MKKLWSALFPVTRPPRLKLRQGAPKVRVSKAMAMEATAS
jgi:hypothetical protein